MTEKEIIKGLECCSKFSPGICKECSCYDIPCNMCSRMLMQNALNLINRQKAEIEELTEKHHNECRQIAKYDDSLRQYRSLLKYQKKELERINRNMDSMVNEHDRLLKDILTAPVNFIPKNDLISPHTISKEAVKKFAEALKAELGNLSKVHLFGATFALVGENFIDGFVEKYEGENNDI